jgi:RecB family exonuclease
LDALERSLAETPVALAGAGAIGISRFVAALRADWARRPVRTAGDPGGVRVLGRLEPRSLEFEELHLGGLSSDRFPGSAVTGGGVLSEADRGALGLPPADRRADEARHLVYRALLAPTQRLSLSWPSREGATPLHPADLIVELGSLLQGSPIEAPATPIGPLAQGLVALGRGEPGAAAHGPASRGIAVDAVRRGRDPWSRWEGRLGAVQDLAVRLGPTEHVFSPSQLEAALRCPFAWFSERVLRLDQAEDDDDDDALPAIWGDLVHRILARWALDKELPVTPQARMRRSVQTTLAEAPWRDLKGPFWEVQRAGLERGLLRRFLAAEAESGRTPTHAELRFGPVAGEARDLEDPRSTDEPLILGRGADAVRIAGKVDRVDAADGWVFDYKTGRPPAIRSVGKGSSVQLPIYLLALRRQWKLPVDQSNWYRLRPDTMGPPRGAWPGRGVEVEVALAEVEADIVERIARLRLGEMTVVPAGKSTCPPRCSYSRMCRVDDRRIVAARNAEDAT